MHKFYIKAINSAKLTSLRIGNITGLERNQNANENSTR